MNADFEYHPSSDLDIQESLGSPSASGALSPDRFELLSAYLDGELSPTQRKQVEAWLDTDASVQRLYAQLLRMREAMKTVPIPEFATSNPDELAKRVFERVDRQPRVLVLWAGVGAAIAATCVAALSGLLTGRISPQMAISPDQSPAQSVAYSPAPNFAASVQPDSLMISLDQPVVEIPNDL
jgi:anti-sigma factor RsiW